MERNIKWPSILADCIELSRHIPFGWGQNDCCLFACEVVRYMTGEDIAADFRGKYNSALTAFKLLKEQFGGGVAEMAEQMAERLGVKEQAVPYAQRGDVVLVDTELGDALGICLGVNIAAAGRDGLVFVPRKYALRAWRI